MMSITGNIVTVALFVLLFVGLDVYTRMQKKEGKK